MILIKNSQPFQKYFREFYFSNSILANKNEKNKNHTH